MNTTANVVSTVIVSSTIVARGTYGWGYFKASVISWDAIRSWSIDDICGIGEL